MSYSYLDGSQTGMILNQTPSVPGNYQPGQGTAPYAAPMGTSSLLSGGISGANSAYNPSNYSNLSNWEQQKLASIASGHDKFMVDEFMNSISNKASPSSGTDVNGQPTTNPLSSYTGSSAGASLGGTSPSSSSDPLVVGQSANIDRNADIWGQPINKSVSSGSGGGGAGGGTSGGGSGGGGGTGGGTSGGVQGPLNLSGVPNQYPTPNFNSPAQINGGPQNYLPPGGQQQGFQQGSPVGMSQSGPQGALGQYFNTAGYQLTNNPSDPSMSASQRFQQSPGYQWGVDQAMQQVQRNGASRGLLESGSVMRAMGDRAQGMANQDFNNWQNVQNQQYGNYQNRLQGLSAGPTGADYAFNTGGAMGQNAMASGSNMASLLGNQGSAGYGATMNTGGAMSNNILQAGSQQAQIGATNQANLASVAAARGLF